MRHLRLVGLAVLAGMIVSSPASAQRTRARSASSTEKSLWEIGVDARLSFGLDTPKLTTLSIPLGSIRAGVFTSDVLEIEPFFSLNSVSGGGSSFTSYQFGVGGLYHFSPERTKSQVYARPFLALVGSSGGGVSNSDLGIGIGAGMKWPRLNGRMAWRGEVNFMSVNNATSLNVLWGISFFTR
jgi:hypothetical protein